MSRSRKVQIAIGVLVVLIVAGALMVEQERTVAADNRAKDIAVKAAISTIRQWIVFYGTEGGDVFPAPELVNAKTMIAAYRNDPSWYAGVGRWPDNPFTGKPMALGHSPGDIEYQISGYGSSFELVGLGHDGKPIIKVSPSSVIR